MPVHQHPIQPNTSMVEPSLNGRTAKKFSTMKSGSRNVSAFADVKIIDIRRERTNMSLAEDINALLRPSDGGEKRLPTMLLYDEAGLILFEDITYLEEYYPTEAEIEVLKTHADDIAKSMKPGSVLVELGSGNLRKINILLRAIEKLEIDVEYYALDLSLPELQRTITDIDHDSFNHVKIFGLHGTYDDGLVWMKSSSVGPKPKTILSLGSSIGNFTRQDAAGFLRGFAEMLAPNDTLLIGVDACKDPDRVYHAYNDGEGTTHRFILNGLTHANRVLDKEAFKLDQWRVIGEYDIEAGRHQAFLSPWRDVHIEGVLIKANEKIRIEESYKYSEEDAAALWASAGVVEAKRWPNRQRDYGIHKLMRKMSPLPLTPEAYAASPVPTWEEWTELWKLWDIATRQMIPDEELLSKPIKLRNACIFYLGHIPTFVDIKLTEVLKEPPTEPASYPKIFERGIDPDVDDPATVHAHSAIPDEWPELSEILSFQNRVRQRIKNLYLENVHHDIEVGRALWLGYEHEYMHLETLLYMLVQSDKTVRPPTEIPDFKGMAQVAKSQAVPNEWVAVPASDVILGLDDPEYGSDKTRYYGWDIEKPSRSTHVKAFSAKARPITNGEYARYLEETANDTIPAAWARSTSQKNGVYTNGVNGVNGHTNGVHGHTNGNHEPVHHVASASFLEGKLVKTVYGAVPLSQALDWPVSASYGELKGCAAWMGGRIPTLEETRSIYNYVDLRSRKEAQNTLNTTTPAVNGHLVNDGVEESPPSKPLATKAVGSGLKPHDLFVDLQGCNVGFQNWHPVPVTQNGNRLSGMGDMGGLWEWTSTALKKHEGFEPMKLYPVYSADFFDDKHNVVLGGSWATAPRLAGRKSFVNWYQKNYPYVWATARVVRDV